MSASASTNPTSPSVTSISCDRCAPTRGTAVVAGATGYLGRHVVKALHARGFRVRAVVRDPKRLGSALSFCHEVVVGQVTEPETLPGIFDDTDIAFSSIGVRHFRRRPTPQEVDFRANAVDGRPRFRESAIGGPEIFTQREIADLAFKVVSRRPRYGHISGRTLEGAARLLQPFNRNAASIKLMFSALAKRDAVAPCLGTHRLADHFAELTSLRKAG